MALYFGLYAECGTDRRQAESLVDAFESNQCNFSDGLITTYSASVTSQDNERNWWVHIWPRGISRTSPAGDRAELKDTIHITEAGLALYNRLKQCDTYRYARVGWEAEEFRLQNEFDQEDFVILDGLVLSTERWNAYGQPKGYVNFSSGYVWLTWEGEKGYWQ